MRHVVAALVGAVIALAFTTIKFSYRIYNLEKQMIRIEQGYNAVLAENEKLERMSEQCLILMTGGWDEMVSISTDN